MIATQTNKQRGNKMAISLYAQPHNIDATGFYFSDYEEYTEKQESCRDSFGNVVEEFEIHLIGGAGDFAHIIKPDQCNLEEWFEQAEQFGGLSDTEQTAFQWLVDDLNMDADEAFEKCSDVCIFEGTREEYAQQFVDDCYDLDRTMGNLARYFDYDAFGRDLELGGDIVEISPRMWVTNPHDF
jgi:hypothetical protein